MVADELFNDALSNQHSTGIDKETQLPMEDSLEFDSHNRVDARDIITFWDENGFGTSNLHGKKQLLSWLDTSKFLNPKEVVLKAMTIACSNNTRILNYVLGILKNWENSSLLTVEEIDSYNETMLSKTKTRIGSENSLGGRSIPTQFELDLTAGEDL